MMSRFQYEDNKLMAELLNVQYWINLVVYWGGAEEETGCRRS